MIDRISDSNYGLIIIDSNNQNVIHQLLMIIPKLRKKIQKNTTDNPGESENYGKCFIRLNRTFLQNDEDFNSSTRFNDDEQSDIFRRS